MQNPLTLVESSPVVGTSESTPTAFGERFHYAIIANGAIAMALDGDQRKDSQPWWDRYGMAMDNLTAWLNERGGHGMVDPHFSSSPQRPRDNSADW